MNIRIILVLIGVVMVLAPPLLAREKTDVIVMKNGDRITCEIKGLRSNTLYISVDYILDTLSVDWSKVDHVESNQLFLFRMRDGSVYTGALTTPKTASGASKVIDVVEVSEKQVTLERTQVVDMTQTSANFWQRFNSQIGTGFAYSKANNSAQYNLNSDINYPRERWSAGASYNSNLTSNTGAKTSTRNEVAITAQRLMRWNNWQYTGLADFLQSSAQGIQLQSTFGGGVGRIIKNTGSTYFGVYGGLAWERIHYQETVVSFPAQHVVAGLIGTHLNLFQFDRTTLKLNANLLPAISEPGRVHFALNASYYVKLWGKLNWNLSVYDNWDNRPPPGFSGSDYGTTSGVSLSFGNR